MRELTPDQLGTWVVFAHPRDAHHAAFEAWLHVPSRISLVKLWYADELASADCDFSRWQWRVIHPVNGWWRVVPYVSEHSATARQLAEPVIDELLAAIEAAR